MCPGQVDKVRKRNVQTHRLEEAGRVFGTRPAGQNRETPPRREAKEGSPRSVPNAAQPLIGQAVSTQLRGHPATAKDTVGGAQLHPPAAQESQNQYYLKNTAESRISTMPRKQAQYLDV